MVKFCECGCGGVAPISPVSHKKWNYVKGQPRRFIRGHATKGKKYSPKIARRIAEGNKKTRFQKGHKAYTDGSNLLGLQAGKKHWKWNGGRWRTTGGYIKIYMPRHPCATHNFVFEHRLVVEANLERFLKPKEIVHHINGVKDDNRLVNLYVCKNKTEHNKIHRGTHPKCPPPPQALVAKFL